MLKINALDLTLGNILSDGSVVMRVKTFKNKKVVMVSRPNGTEEIFTVLPKQTSITLA